MTLPVQGGLPVSKLGVHLVSHRLVKGPTQMNLYRKEVSDFIRLAETLLSPASLGEPLTKEECRVVDFYVTSLAGHCASLGYNSTEESESCPLS